MRWLVVGAAGMLGTDLLRVLAEHDETAVGVGRRELDVTDSDATLAAVRGYDVVVNCAAYTAVDAAESDEPAAFAVNALGPANLARACAATGARLVQISTDYVFDGSATEAYPHDAPVAPRSAYGRTKLAGEWAVRAETDDVLVVRTAWLYGAHGRCFPKTIARVGRERGGLDVIDDQVGQPTWTVDLAALVVALVQRQAPAGVYHGTASGRTSWHGFARAVVRAAGLDPEIVRSTTSDAFASPAPRPAFSVLDHASVRAAGVEPIGDWQERWAVAAESVLV